MAAGINRLQPIRSEHWDSLWIQALAQSSEQSFEIPHDRYLGLPAEKRGTHRHCQKRSKRCGHTANLRALRRIITAGHTPIGRLSADRWWITSVELCIPLLFFIRDRT